MERDRKKWYLEEKGRELKHQAEIKVISEWCFVEWMNADLMRFISNILQGQQGNPNYAGWPSSLLIRVMCLIKEVQFFLVLQEANRKPAASIHPVSPSLLHTQAQTKSCSAASLTPCILMHTRTCGVGHWHLPPLPSQQVLLIMPGFRRKHGLSPPLDEEEAVENAMVSWQTGEKQSNSCMQIKSSHRSGTHVSQQMPQVIMQLRVVLLGALIKYSFYLAASSPCLVMYK